MNTSDTLHRSNLSPRALRRPRHEPDDSLLDEFDGLVRNASRGDARAVAALAVGLGSELLALLRPIVGNADATEVLNEFLDALVDRRAGRFHPSRERALRWIERVLVRMARAHRRGREWERREGGDDLGDPNADAHDDD
jgi:DNA-directed RNA polymerase specialized sigma24 family protein